MRVTVLLIATIATSVSLPVAAAAQELPQIDPTPYGIHLAEISRSEKGTRATLWDRYNQRAIPLRSTDGESTFRIGDAEDRTLLTGTVTHIGGRDVLFRTGDNHYAIHLGNPTLYSSLREPLTDEHVAALKKDTPQQPAAKTYSFEMRNAPWGTVFEWLSDRTDMKNVSGTIPVGNFTFFSPANKSYTLPEVIDILNEALSAQNYMLIRRDDSFAIVSAADPIDPTILPRVKVEELGQRGPNELVTVVLPLGELDAGEIVAEVRGLFGKFGFASTLSRTNQLLLQDTAGNLKRIIDVVKELEAKQPTKTSEKSWALELRDVPWPDVFKWLTEQTGLPVVGQAKPAGAFTFVGVDKKTYALPEVVDILNDALTVQKLLLIRRGHSFALVPSDEPVDATLVPRIKISELSARGNSELVSVALPVINLTADDVAIEAERVMGPLGRVVPLSKANQVILQDTAGNLKRTIETVRAMEERTRRRF